MAISTSSIAAMGVATVAFALPTITVAPAVPIESEVSHHLRHNVRPRSLPLQDDVAGRTDRDHSFLRRLFRHDDEGASRLAASHGDSDAADKDEIINGEVELLLLNDGLDDYSDRRLQSTVAEDQWYVDWGNTKCVQTCEPTSSNPHCAGKLKYATELFQDASQCCGIALSWTPPDDCTATGHPDTAMTALLGEDQSFQSGEDCPDEYAQGGDYVGLDRATLYLTETEGEVYECKEGVKAQFCSMFAPNWSVVNAGGAAGDVVHSASEAFGWELMGDCVGQQFIPTATSDELDGGPDDGSQEGNPDGQGGDDGMEGSDSNDSGGSDDGSGTGESSGGQGGDDGMEGPGSNGSGVPDDGSGTGENSGGQGGPDDGMGGPGSNGSGVPDDGSGTGENSGGQGGPDDGMGGPGSNGSGGPEDGSSGPGGMGATSPADIGFGSGSGPGTGVGPASKPSGGRPGKPGRPIRPKPVRPVRPKSPETATSPAASPSNGGTSGLTSPGVGSISFGSGSDPSDVGEQPGASSSNGGSSGLSGNDGPSNGPGSGSGNDGPSNSSGPASENDGSLNGSGSGPSGASEEEFSSFEPESNGSGSLNDGQSNGSGPSGANKEEFSSFEPESNGSVSGNNDSPSSGSGSGPPGAGKEEISSFKPESGSTGSAAYVKPASAQKPPSIKGNNDGTNGGDGDDSDRRPKVDWPDKPDRPYKPKPGIQVQSAPQGGNDDEDSMLIIDEETSKQCWRSGTVCETDAARFVCCTACIQGYCI
jgi:hypothetical protein